MYFILKWEEICNIYNISYRFWTLTEISKNKCHLFKKRLKKKLEELIFPHHSLPTCFTTFHSQISFSDSRTFLNPFYSLLREHSYFLAIFSYEPLASYWDAMSSCLTYFILFLSHWLILTKLICLWIFIELPYKFKFKNLIYFD